MRSTAGAELRLGGARIEGQFFEPSILTGVTPDMAMSCEETFGPVAGIARFATEAEAVAIANDTPYGLSAYFFTSDLGRTWRVGEALEYGIVGINTGLISTEVAPFGGVKESGIGREGSCYGVDDWVELKYSPSAESERRVCTVIVEQRDYHVYTGKLPELVRLYENEGIAIQQRGARRLRRRVHDRDRRPLDLHAHVALRQLRRARGAARRAAGARRLEGVPREDPAADPHAAEPDPDPDVVLAAAVRWRQMGELDGKVAIVTGGAQGIGKAIADGLAAEGARIVDRRPAGRRGGRRSVSRTVSG